MTETQVTGIVLGRKYAEVAPPPSLIDFEIKNNDDALKRIKIAAGSCQGIGYKKINEDRIVLMPELNSFSVIDGLGGPGGGDKAADLFSRALLSIKKIDRVSLLDLLQNIVELMKSDMVLRKSGVCFLTVWVVNSKFYICYAGDVRLIIWDSEHENYFETLDHSMINELIATDNLSPEDALFHPSRHIVTKALTGNMKVNVDFLQIPIYKGYRFLIASDGLWDNYTSEEVTEITRKKTLEESYKILMEKSLLKMSNRNVKSYEGKLQPKPDNISILAGEIF